MRLEYMFLLLGKSEARFLEKNMLLKRKQSACMTLGPRNER